MNLQEIIKVIAFLEDELKTQKANKAKLEIKSTYQPIIEKDLGSLHCDQENCEGIMTASSAGWICINCQHKMADIHPDDKKSWGVK